MGYLLVIAVARLALGADTADDVVRLEGVAGAEIVVSGRAETLEGSVGTKRHVSTARFRSNFESILG